MKTLNDIDALTKKYADAHGSLCDTVAALGFEIEQVKSNYLKRIKEQVRAAKARKAELKAAIEESPALFTKPRTLVLHGTEVGLKKAKGKIEFEDADQVVKLIRKHFPEQFDVLVKTDETPVKTALGGLTVSELKKLGIEVSETGDYVLIKDAASDVAKAVKAFLKEDEGDE